MNLNSLLGGDKDKDRDALVVLHSIDAGVQANNKTLCTTQETVQKIALQLAGLVAWKEGHEKFDKEAHKVCKEERACVREKVGKIEKESKERDETLHDRIGRLMKEHIIPLIKSVNMGQGGLKVLLFIMSAFATIALILAGLGLFNVFGGR